jgi:hypothetical protein
MNAGGLKKELKRLKDSTLCALASWREWFLFFTLEALEALRRA